MRFLVSIKRQTIVRQPQKGRGYTDTIAPIKEHLYGRTLFTRLKNPLNKARKERLNISQTSRFVKVKKEGDQDMKFIVVLQQHGLRLDRLKK